MTSEGKSFLTENFIASQSLSQVWMEETHSQIWKWKYLPPFLGCAPTKELKPAEEGRGWPKEHGHPPYRRKGKEKTSGRQLCNSHVLVGRVICPLVAFVLFSLFSLSLSLNFRNSMYIIGIVYVLNSIVVHMYWPLNNAGDRISSSLCDQKSSHNFWLPPNFTANSLLLTRSLTDKGNSLLTHILYVICIIYCVIEISYLKSKLKKRKY